MTSASDVDSQDQIYRPFNMDSCNPSNNLFGTSNSLPLGPYSSIDIESCYERCPRAERFNDLLSQHLPPSVHDWTCNDDGWRFEFEHISVLVINNEVESFHVLATSDTMHRRYLDRLRQQLRCILQGMAETDLTPTGFAVKLIELCEEANAWEGLWREESKSRSSRLHSGDTKEVKPEGWDASEVKDWESILDNPTGLKLSTIQDTAREILGQSLEEICSGISENLRILHVEPVFRNDLVAKFLNKQAKIHRDVLNMPYNALRQSVSPMTIPRGSREDNIAGLAEHLARQRVTFHGAPHRVIQSIVRYGFIIPGDEIGDSGKQLAVQHGSAYGNGIYSSPQPMYALAYSDYDVITHGTLRQPADVPSMPLLVCATLMGRPMVRERNQGHKGDLLSGHAHSHVSPNQLQYIVFDSAQIVPVYVLHLDLGAEAARKEFDMIASNPNYYFWRRRKPLKIDRVVAEKPEGPGDVQRKKQALKAAATKWFPYGYGPTQGNKFVIEEIADVSDDEEAYGDLQVLRMDMVEDLRQRTGDDRANWFDEFQTVRKTNHGVKMCHN